MTEQDLQKTEITLKLPLGAVNVIMTALGTQAYAQVADIVQSIREQAIPQLPVPAPSEAKPEVSAQ